LQTTRIDVYALERASTPFEAARHPRTTPSNQKTNVDPRIEIIDEKKLIGMRASMSMVQNRTSLLWRTFMPRRKEVLHRTTEDYISMQVYTNPKTDLFSATAEFVKWAVAEVSSFDAIPDGMEPYTLKGGRYAVFIHEGPAYEAPRTMGYIFDVWLPASEYELDDREHFEILPESYNPIDKHAREEIWIPVR